MEIFPIIISNGKIEPHAERNFSNGSNKSEGERKTNKIVIITPTGLTHIRTRVGHSSFKNQINKRKILTNKVINNNYNSDKANSVHAIMCPVIVIVFVTVNTHTKKNRNSIYTAVCPACVANIYDQFSFCSESSQCLWIAWILLRYLIRWIPVCGRKWLSALVTTPLKFNTHSLLVTFLIF